MQRLTAALQQTVVSCVLNQRMLEPIACFRGRALNKEEVGLDEIIEVRPETLLRTITPAVTRILCWRCWPLVAGRRRDLMQERVGEAPAENRADLCDFARRSQSVEAGRKRLHQGRRNCLRASVSSTLEKQPRHLFDEERNAAGSFPDTFDEVA